MTTVFGELDHVLLMAPGPSPVAPNVLKAMSIPARWTRFDAVP